MTDIEDALLFKEVTLLDGVLRIDGTPVEFETDYGDCCGYAYGDSEFFASGVITRVDETLSDMGYVDKITITVYHEETTLAKFTLEAGSGSGWQYGAISRLVIKVPEVVVAEVHW
jgi:hypothetical protein